MGLCGVKNVAFMSSFSESVFFPSGYDVIMHPSYFATIWLVCQSVCLYVLVIKFMLGVMTKYQSIYITACVVVDEYIR
jgi:hypothetical protein